MDALLEVRGVTKSFGGLVAVNNVDFEVGGDEIVGLIGPNGAGKSTIFNLVSGVYRPDRGVIRFKGENITGLKPHAVCRKGIARTFQIVKPFTNMTVLENIVVGAVFGKKGVRDLREAEKRAEGIAEFVGLRGKKGVLAENLNIAEQRRLELAKALASEPKLLMIDEVMAGLNPLETKLCMDLIQTIRGRGVSVLLIEHVMKAVMGISRRIIVLNQGEKIAEGAPEEVAANTSVIDAYLGETVAPRV